MPPPLTYPEATAYLYGLRRFGWRPGLASIERLLALVGDPQAGLPALHVGGTNGKGSTAAMLAAILRAAGLRTGLYTSPHLLRFTERIRVDGRPMGEAEVVEAVARLAAACAGQFTEDPAAPSPGDRLPHPTFFELTTAMAFLHFAQQRVDVGVVEVGLGGRLDATNVLRPRLALLTNVGFDHREYLGETLEQIAGEKAGIIKPGCPVVTGAEGAALAVFRRVAALRGAPLLALREAYAWTVRHAGLEGTTFDLSGPGGAYAALRIPLAGRHQVGNAALAVAAAEALAIQGFRIDEAAIRRGLESVRWPGRLTLVPGRPRTLLDGAHNPPGAAALAAFLSEHRSRLGRLHLVFGVLRDKAWGEMLATLLPWAAAVVLTRPATERAEDPAALARAIPALAGAPLRPEVAQAIEAARRLAGPEDTILITGSLYTVAEGLRALGLSAE